MRVRFAVVPVLLSALGWSTGPSSVHAHGVDCEAQEDAVLACMNAAGVTSIADVYACEGCIDQLADAGGEETDQDSCTAADTAACSALPDCPCAGCDEEATALLQCGINDDRLHASSPCVEASCESPGAPPAATTSGGAGPIPLRMAWWVTWACAAVIVNAKL
jgi:hypothetical protein